ncbi:hypothetical protein C8R45DRAFT_928969 [Mycena sanguinolenta]|nr:hypothetical protein C8R45DRAFT_928969 [Mycena sanguinolenta]
MDATVSIWLNFDGKLRRIICIPTTKLLSLCKYPSKWVFFVAHQAFGTINCGYLYKADNRQDQGKPLLLCRVSLEGMESPNFATDYYFFGPAGKKPRYADAAGMSDRVSNHPSEKQVGHIREWTVLRDIGCLVCREDAEGCQAAHIIPHKKGNENAIFISSSLHSRMKSCEVAFLLLTPQSILQPTDIPDGPLAGDYCPLREGTKEKLVKVVGEKAVNDAIAKEAIPTASANYLIFQHMVDDIHDRNHPHNTRACLPQIDAPAQYLLDFHYVMLILMLWGSEHVLGHPQPLRRRSVHHVYYDSPANVDSDSDNESDNDPEFIILNKDGESKGEDKMDDEDGEDGEDNPDKGRQEDPEKGDDPDDSKMDDDFSNGDNIDTEWAKQKGGGMTEQQDESETESVNSGKLTSRPSTPDCDMQHLDNTEASHGAFHD